MDLDDLRTLVVLAEARDVDRAARGLHAGAATVRRRIARLEHDFGGPLVLVPGPDAPPGAGLELTPLGEQVLDKALDVLEAAADLLHAVHRPAHRPYVIVGALYRLLLDELADVVPDLDRMSGGDVSLETREFSDDDPSAGLARGRVDAAVLAGPTDLDASLVRRPVGQVARVALLAAHHPLAGRSGIEVRDLDRDAWVDGVHVPDGSWPAFWRCEDVRGRPPASIVPANGLAGQVEAVRLGAGVAVRPASLPALLGLQAHGSGVVAVPLVDAPPCPVDLAHRLDSPYAELLDALAAHLSAALDARPVGVRIRASSVVAGAVVTGIRHVAAEVGSGGGQPALAARPRANGGGPRRPRLGLTGRLRSLTGSPSAQ